MLFFDGYKGKSRSSELLLGDMKCPFINRDITGTLQRRDTTHIITIVIISISVAIII
jgi:hypothetical protein